MELLAGIVGIAWNVGILALLWRWRHHGTLFIVVAAYLLSLYTADRLLPKVLVDAWPNLDAARSPALRPMFILPDVLLFGALVARVRQWPSTPARVLLVALGLSTVVGVVGGLLQAAVPTLSAFFWATAPLRGMAMVLLVDATVARDGSRSATIQVVAAVTVGAAVLAIEMLGIVGLKWSAELAGYDLASVWSGFNLARPNLPGINNNIAASIIGFGAAATLTMPRWTTWPTLARGFIVAVSAASVILAEYRTGIIVLALAAGVRVAIEVFHRLPTAAKLTAIAAACLSGGVISVVLLTLSALAVPRFVDINPIGYVGQTLSGATNSPSPRATFPSSSISPQPTGDVSDGGETADSSTRSRAQILQAALTVWRRSPIAGPGLGSWEFARPIQPRFLQNEITPHSGYAWVLADLGLLGFAALYLIPAVLVLLRRPPLEILVWLVLLAILELAVVGVAHSRYGAMYWAALALGALAPWTETERASTEPAILN